MFAILTSLNAHNFPIFQLISMILVSKFMVHSRALSNKKYLSLGLLSPLMMSGLRQSIEGYTVTNFFIFIQSDVALHLQVHKN